MHSFIASKIFNYPFEFYLAAVDRNKRGVSLPITDTGLLKERQIAKAAGFAINKTLFI